ncbi:hypothetical protein D3C80_2117960 [compost metagenome]
MPAILAQVHGDAIGTGFLGIQRGLHRVRITGTARLAQGGDMIDIHTEKDAIGFSHGQVP